MLGFRTLRPIAVRAFRPALVQPWAYPRKSFHELSGAGADHHSPGLGSSGTTKKLAKIILVGPMHNHVIVNGFEGLRESMKGFGLGMKEGFKEMKLDTRENIKEMNLELKEEIQGFRRGMRWLLGTYLGAILAMFYYDSKFQNEKVERLTKIKSEEFGAGIRKTLKSLGTPRPSSGLF